MIDDREIGDFRRPSDAGSNPRPKGARRYWNRADTSASARRRPDDEIEGNRITADRRSRRLKRILRPAAILIYVGSHPLAFLYTRPARSADPISRVVVR